MSFWQVVVLLRGAANFVGLRVKGSGHIQFYAAWIPCIADCGWAYFHQAFLLSVVTGLKYPAGMFYQISIAPHPTALLKMYKPKTSLKLKPSQTSTKYPKFKENKIKIIMWVSFHYMDEISLNKSWNKWMFEKNPNFHSDEANLCHNLFKVNGMSNRPLKYIDCAPGPQQTSQKPKRNVSYCAIR